MSIQHVFTPPIPGGPLVPVVHRYSGPAIPSVDSIVRAATFTAAQACTEGIVFGTVALPLARAAGDTQEWIITNPAIRANSRVTVDFAATGVIATAGAFWAIQVGPVANNSVTFYVRNVGVADHVGDVLPTFYFRVHTPAAPYAP